MIFSLASCGVFKNLFSGSLKLTSFTVDNSSVKREYYIGEEIDFSGIKAVAKYSDSSLDKEYTAAELTVTYPEDITATEGQKAVKVSFQDPHLNVEQSTMVQIVVSEDPNIIKSESFKIDASGVKKFYNMGETVSLTGLKLIEVMSDKSERVVEDTTALTHDDTTSLTATAGTKSVKFYYEGNPVGTVVFRVLDPADTRNNVTDAVAGGNYKTVYEVGQTLTLEGLTVTVTYETGDPVVLTADQLTLVEGVDMSEPGSKDVRVIFTDANGDKDFTYITINVVKKDTVLGFVTTGNLLAFDSDNAGAGTHNFGEAGFSGEFAVGNQTYKIGDDNVFVMLPTMTIRDTDGLPSAPLARYYSEVEIYVHDGSDFVKLDKTSFNQTTYVYTMKGETLATVDTYNGRYQFAKPISKVKIEVRPHSDYYTGTFTPVTLVAEVIDAYNVTESWQLSLIDNSEFVSTTQYKTAWGDIKTEHGLNGLQVKGVVLHNDITLTVADIPEAYLKTAPNPVTYIKVVDGQILDTKVAPAGTKYLTDNTFIYSRYNSEFAIEGNFFTIDASALPLVGSPSAVPGTGYDNYGTDFSTASLFRFQIYDQITYGENGEEIHNDKDLPMSVSNTMLIGNAGRNNWVVDNGSGVYSMELASAGGIVLFKSELFADVKFDNILNNSFFLSYNPDWGGKMEITNSKAYDSYQNAIVISRNAYCKVDSSVFSGTGGPIVLGMGAPDNDTGVPLYPSADITNTVLDSALTGEELWFKALGMVNADVTSLVNTIKATKIAGPDGTVYASFSNSQGMMNIKGVMLYNMNFKDWTAQGNITIDGHGINRNHTDAVWLSILQSAGFQAGAPVLTVYSGDTAYSVYQGADDNLYDLNNNKLGTQQEHAAYMGAFATANEIVLSQGGLSIVLQLFH